jgi:hypothetical protein
MSGVNTVLGGGADTVFNGTTGADTVTGSADADSILGLAGADILSGEGGSDTIDGGADADFIDGGTGADSLVGGIGGDTLLGDGGDILAGGADNDSLIGSGDGNTLAGQADEDTIFSTGNSNAIVGGAGDDFMSSAGDANTMVGSDVDLSNASAGEDTMVSAGDFNLVVGNAQNQAFTISGGSNTLTGLNGADSLYFDGSSGGGNSFDGGNGGNDWANIGQYSGFTVSGGTTIYETGGLQSLSGFETVVCFAEGSDILTAHGEVRVEKLQAGHLVATVSGQGAPMKPVLWVGRRKVKLAGNPAASLLAPVRIAAGALGECTPHRDLLVSPDHCLYVDGSLVAARLLVNGTTITVEHNMAEVTYFHVELEGHDVLLANGAAAESWLDAGNRAWFENAGVAMIQVADAPDAYATATGAKLCAPVLHGGEQLAAIRDAIALRAAAVPATPAEAPRRAAG